MGWGVSLGGFVSVALQATIVKTRLDSSVSSSHTTASHVFTDHDTSKHFKADDAVTAAEAFAFHTMKHRLSLLFSLAAMVSEPFLFFYEVKSGHPIHRLIFLNMGTVYDWVVG